MFIIIHLENYTKPRLSTLYVCLFQNIVCQDCCSALHCFFTARNAWCCQSAKPEIIQISGRNVARLCHHGTYTLTLLGGSAYPLRPVSCDCDNFHRWFSFHERCDIGHALVRKKTQKKTLPVRKQRPWTNMSATLPLGTQFCRNLVFALNAQLHSSQTMFQHCVLLWRHSFTVAKQCSNIVFCFEGTASQQQRHVLLLFCFCMCYFPAETCCKHGFAPSQFQLDRNMVMLQHVQSSRDSPRLSRDSPESRYNLGQVNLSGSQ